MKIKLNLTANGRSRKLNLFCSVLDFFFSYPKFDKNRIRIIRKEAGGMSRRGKTVLREFYTLRAFCSYIYFCIFSLPIIFVKKAVEEIKLSSQLDPLYALRGAIAFVASGSPTGGSGTSITYSGQAAGASADAFMLGAFNQSASTDDITGVTFGGNSMTRVNGTNNGVNTQFTSLYAIGSSNASGTKDVVISLSASRTVDISWGSYSGTNLNSAGSNTDANDVGYNGSTVASFTLALTTVADNCWTVMVVWAANSTTTTAGTGLTLRETDSGFDNTFLDSNSAITPPASYSMAVNFSPNSRYNAVTASIAPSVAVYTPRVIFF